VLEVDLVGGCGGVHGVDPIGSEDRLLEPPYPSHMRHVLANLGSATATTETDGLTVLTYLSTVGSR
jgi:hypothetical protein